MRIRSLAVAALLLVAIPAAAHAGGAAKVCEGRLLSVALKNVSGQWVTVWEGSQPLDFLDTKTPTFVIANKGTIAPGKYINVKIRISETFVVAGSDGINRTKEGGRSILSGSAPTLDRIPAGEIISYEEAAPTWNEEAEGRMTTVLNYDYADKDDYIEIFRLRELQDPLLITEKSVMKVWMTMSLTSSVQFVLPSTLALRIPEQKSMVFHLPHKITEMVVRVDTSSRYVKGPELVLQF